MSRRRGLLDPELGHYAAPILCLVCGRPCAAKWTRDEPVHTSDGGRWKRRIVTYRHPDGRECRVPLGALFTTLPDPPTEAPRT